MATTKTATKKAEETTETAADNVYAALAAAQNDIGRIFKNATNPHYRSAYLDLAGLIDAVQPSLSKYNLTLYHTTRPPQNEFEQDDYIEAHLVHTPTGQEIVSTYPLRAKDTTDPQKLGAAMTYARRYTALAVLGLAAEDDDGNYSAGVSNEPPIKAQTAHKAAGGRSTGRLASEKQKDFVASLLAKEGVKSEQEQDEWLKNFVGRDMANLTSADAKSVIDDLKGAASKPAAKRTTTGRAPF